MKATRSEADKSEDEGALCWFSDVLSILEVELNYSRPQFENFLYGAEFSTYRLWNVRFVNVTVFSWPFSKIFFLLKWKSL